MAREASPAGTRRSRVRHVSRTVLTLGAVLLLGVSIGLAAEIWLREIAAAAGVLVPAYTSVRETLALALGSLESAAPLVAALVAVPLILAGFLRRLYGTVTAEEAHRRLNRAIFGALGGMPRISVREGSVASGDVGLRERLGSPASLTVYDDSAVLTERYGRLARILGTGVHTLRRHETIWETIDLRPHRWVRQVFALTREGIPITCEMDVVFQIGSEPPASSSPAPCADAEEAMPPRYEDETVLRAATATRVYGENGRAERRDWTDRVASMAEGVVRDTLGTYQLDSLIKPREADPQHPRDEMHKRLGPALQEQLRGVGARLLDVKVGEIRVGISDARVGAAQPGTGQSEVLREVSKKVSEIVSTQWIEAWDASSRIKGLVSGGEGRPEPADAESTPVAARADVIMDLVDVLQPMLRGEHPPEPRRLAVSLVDALRWMSLDPRTRDHMPPDAVRTLERLRDLLSSDRPAPAE